MMKDGQILHLEKRRKLPQKLTDRYGNVQFRPVVRSNYSETLNISNLRNIENNCTVLRVISEQSPMEMR